MDRVEKQQQHNHREYAADLSTKLGTHWEVLSTENYNEIVVICQDAHSNVPNDSNKQKSWSGGLLLLAVSDDAVARAARAARAARRQALLVNDDGAARSRGCSLTSLLCSN